MNRKGNVTLLHFSKEALSLPLYAQSAEQPSSCNCKQILLKPSANTAVVQGSVMHTALHSPFSLTRLTNTHNSKNRKSFIFANIAYKLGNTHPPKAIFLSSIIPILR